MTKHRSGTPESDDIRQEVMKTVGQSVFREFNVAFTLMSLIPLIIGIYILAARIFTISIFEGLNGLYFFIAVVFALLGFAVGRKILSTVLGKLIDVNVQVRQHEMIKSAFVSNVAYELRPPLAAVQMSLKNMDDGLLGSLTDPQQTTVHECAEIVGRLARMATDLIEITRSDKGKPALQLDVLALQDLIQEVVERHQGRFWLEGDPGRSSRLMVNLPSLERQRRAG